MGSPGKTTGVGCHFHLQGIFSTQGLKTGLLHCRRILYQLSHQGTQACLAPNTVPFGPVISYMRRQCARCVSPLLHNMICMSLTTALQGRY